jgi:Big-like domain-containing protein
MRFARPFFRPNSHLQHKFTACGDPHDSSDYKGTSNISPASSILSQTVLTIGSTTTLVSSANPSTYVASPPIFTATVTSTAALSGTVSFTDNATAITGCGAKSLPASGVATCRDGNIQAGTHTISANYSGTASISSSSGQLQQLVNQMQMVVTVSSSENPSFFAQDVTFSAALNPPQFVKDGTDKINFTANGVVIAGCNAAPVEAGATATCTTNKFVLGTNTIVATFAGDTNLTSAGGELVQTVNYQ